MQADTLELAADTIELEPFVTTHADRPDAKTLNLRVDHTAAGEQLTLEGVQIRGLGRPQPRIREAELGEKRVRRHIVHTGRENHLPLFITHSRNQGKLLFRSFGQFCQHVDGCYAALQRFSPDEALPIVDGGS